ELAAGQYRLALQSLAGREDPPAVLTCSALHGRGGESVWEAVAGRHARLAATGGLAERRRRQDPPRPWAPGEDQLRQAVRNRPGVKEIRGDLERQVLDGITPAAVAARRILETFGSPPGGPPN